MVMQIENKMDSGTEVTRGAYQVSRLESNMKVTQKQR